MIVVDEEEDNKEVILYHPEEEFNEALEKYYSLKEKYELSFQEQKRDICEKTNLSWKEKRNLLKKKCVGNCGYVGKQGREGSVFTVKSVDNDNLINGYRVLEGYCNNPDLNQRCFHIKLNVGRFELLPNILKNTKEEIKEIQVKEIVLSNEHRSGYISKEDTINAHSTNSVDNANSNDVLDDNKKRYESILKKYENNLKEYEQTELAVNQTLKEMKKRFIDRNNNMDSNEQRAELKRLMQEYKADVYEKKLHKAPLKYQHWKVVKDAKTNLFTLVEMKIPFEELDVPYLTPPKIEQLDLPGGRRGATRGGKKMKTKNNINNPYSLLGITVNATNQDIKNAYGLKAKQYYPGNNRSSNNAKIFEQIGKAYYNLINNESRQYYNKNGTYMLQDEMDPYFLYAMFQEQE